MNREPTNEILSDIYRRLEALEAFANGWDDDREFEKAMANEELVPITAPAPATDRPSGPESKGNQPAAALAIITYALRIASSSSISSEKRLVMIEKASDTWFELLPKNQKFVLTLIDYASKVALGELQAEQSRKYLTALAPQW